MVVDLVLEGATMITIQFTDNEITELNHERFHHPHPRVQRKMEALYLKAMGMAHHEICRLTRISANTLRGYFREFLEGGVDRLKHFDSGGSTCELDPHADTLARYFVLHPPHTVAEAAEAIERLTGIRRGETQVREFLKKIGLKRRKTGSLPAKADTKAQEEFKKTSYCPG